MTREKMNVIGYVKQIEAEVERKYKLRGYKPDGFECSAYDIKLGILSEMFDQAEELGMDPRGNEAAAYCQLAELYTTCGSWN